MKTIILEGIATSGKTSVKARLVSALEAQDLSVGIVREETTLMPILDNTDLERSWQFLNEVLDRVLKEDVDVLIFDRLFLTHVYRTGSSMEDFREIEARLQEALLVFLKIDEAAVNDYYLQQQRLLEDLVQASSIPLLECDTTDMDFDRVTGEILNKFLNG